MAFLINPIQYNDLNAMNRLEISGSDDVFIIGENDHIIREIIARLEGKLVIVDGYPTSSIEHLCGLIKEYTTDLTLVDVRDLMLREVEINSILSANLTINPEEDPSRLFGKMYKGSYEDFIDPLKAEQFTQQVIDHSGTILLYGLGSASLMFRQHADLLIYIDVTPKDAAIRINHQSYINIGLKSAIEFDEMTRRAYFVDMELAMKLRKELHQSQSISMYLLENELHSYTYVSNKALTSIMGQLARRPFRARPIYIDGIWGGQFLKKARQIPDHVAGKIAWSFELIPLEASIPVAINEQILDIPFVSIMNVEADRILGKVLNAKFDGYFPVRFNYDDTWHSNGNMSIQCHPNNQLAQDKYGDLYGQNEAYYIVVTGHEAKTYCGFEDDGREFLELCKKSEKTGMTLDYQKYIHAFESVPGLQVMLPAGTVHGSGRNQLVLELGSLTIGAYTYKIYDYNRKDSNGKQRPIHTKMAESALRFERDSEWAQKNCTMTPLLLKQSSEFREYLIGRTNDINFETYRVEIETHQKYSSNNEGEFTVITVVDGEEVLISSQKDPSLNYLAKYLDVITIPACIDEYIVEARGKQPVVLHKTRVRKDI